MEGKHYVGIFFHVVFMAFSFELFSDVLVIGHPSVDPPGGESCPGYWASHHHGIAAVVHLKEFLN